MVATLRNPRGGHRSRRRPVSPGLSQAEDNRIDSILATNPYAWYSAEYGQPKNVSYVQVDSATSGDGITMPDSINLDLTGDLEFVCRVKAVDWSSGAPQTLAAKYFSTGNQRAYRLFISATGVVSVAVSADGTALLNSAITPSVALVDNVWQWIKVTLDVDDGAGNRVARLFTAADQPEEPSSWTANGTDTDVGVAAAHFNSTAPLEIGLFNNTFEPFNGQVSRMILRDGIDGEVVADFDARKCYLDGYISDGLEYGTSPNKYIPIFRRSGDKITAPDASHLDITGDLEIVLRKQYTNISGTAVLIRKTIALGDQRAYQVYFTGGIPRLEISTTGIDTPTANPGAADPNGVGVTSWFKVTRRQADGVVQFFAAADTGSSSIEPSVWTQFGTDQVVAAGSAIFNSTAFLAIGDSELGANPIGAKIYRAIVRNGIGGQTVADFNASLSTPFGYVDAYGNPWSVAVPKLKANWTLTVPKVYDRSANLRAPLVFGLGTNQPKALPYMGLPGMYLPSGNGAQFADEGLFSSLDPSLTSPDITIEFQVTPQAGGAGGFVKLTTADTLVVEALSNGTVLTRVHDGGSGKTYGNVAIPYWFSRVPIWIRVFIDIDNGAGGTTVYHSASLDGNSWYMFHSQAQASSLTYRTDGYRARFGLCNSGSPAPVDAIFHKLRVYFNSTLISNFNANACGQSGYTDQATGKAWTISRATSGRKGVVQSPAANSARAQILHGVDDYSIAPAASVPAFGTVGQGTLMAIQRKWGTLGTNDRVLDNKANATSTTVGVLMRSGGVDATDLVAAIADGAVAASAPLVASLVAGTKQALGLRIEAANISSFVNNTESGNSSRAAVTATIDSGLPMYIGAQAGTTEFSDKEFEEYLTWNTPLTPAQRASIVSLLVGV